MHIIVDIRARHPEDMYTNEYAINWARWWKKFSPNDEITYLVFDSQEAPEGEPFIRVKPATWFSAPYKIVSKNKNEIFRCVNFSRYSPYDPSVPTITHIFDMGLWFYDSETNANILRRKEREFEIKRLLKHSSHFIVPSFSTGIELVELWNIHETAVDVVPLLPIKPGKTDDSVFALQNIPENFFLFDATFGIESNLEELLVQFARYHELGWKKHLVLHGNSQKNLKNITDIISRESIQKYVHITWCLSSQAREALYKKAKAWIFVWAYNTSKANIALAKSYNIPLILSDIPSFSPYDFAFKIHPNHLENLANILLDKSYWENSQKTDSLDAELENAIFEKYKRILAENKKIHKKIWK